MTMAAMREREKRRLEEVVTKFTGRVKEGCDQGCVIPNFGHGEGSNMISNFVIIYVQGSAKRCANYVKQQPGRARQKRLGKSRKKFLAATYQDFFSAL